MQTSRPSGVAGARIYRATPGLATGQRSGFLRGEERAGLRRVFGDLRLERVEPGELPLRTEILEERDAEVAAVEIAVEIEEMRLEAEVGPAEGRTRPEIGDARAPLRPALALDAA